MQGYGVYNVAGHNKTYVHMTQVCAKIALILVMPAGLIYEENHTSL